MFSIFKSKSAPEKPSGNPLPSFAMRLIDAARGHRTSEAKLVAQMSLWNQLKELETEFDVSCHELDTLNDDLADSFNECERFEVMLAAGMNIGLLSNLDFGFTDAPDFKHVPESAKCRLLNLHIQAHLDGQARHHTEYEIRNQIAFAAIRDRQLDEFETATVLEKEFGIQGWKSLREMNPDIIYEIPRPRKDA